MDRKRCAAAESCKSVKRPELLASTVTPDGMQMTLMLHAGDYYIEVDGRGLMSTVFIGRMGGPHATAGQ